MSNIQPLDTPVIRRFTREDWYGMAGAAPFADGSEPWVAYLSYGDEVCRTVCADSQGLGVMDIDTDGDDILTVFLPFEGMTPEMAEFLIRRFYLSSAEELAQFGFQEN